MSAGLKTIKSYSLDIEQIYWKNLKNNLIYIFYITRKEKEFFYTNFKNDKLMFFYLFLKYLCGKTKACEFKSSFIRDCFDIKFRQDLTERFLNPLKKANLIKATYNASSHKWHIKLQDESKFNMFSTDLSVTNFIKKEFKDCEFFIPHGIYGFTSYHKGILTFKGNHKYTLKRICEENISSTPNKKLITELRIALDSKKCKVRSDRKVKENNGMKAIKTNKDYGIEHIKDDVLEIIKEKLAEANIEYIAAENPVNTTSNVYKKPTQIIQPHEFITSQWNAKIFKKSYFKGNTIMENKKEIIGIYNVTQNNKSATPIKTDIELIEDAVIEQVIMYVKGYHNIKTDKGYGAEHIKLHLEPNADGYIVLEELLNIGNSLREYTKNFKTPFVETSGRKIYEWENDKQIRFRIIVDKLKREGLQSVPLSPFDSVIITFYSDRNLNERMRFKNKEVETFYTNNTKGENNMDIETYKVVTEKKGGGDRSINYYSINDMHNFLHKSDKFFIEDIETIKDNLRDYCDDKNTIEAIANNEKLNDMQRADKRDLLCDYPLELEALSLGADYLACYRDEHSFIKEDKYDEFIKECYLDYLSDSYKCQISDEIYKFDKHISIDNRVNCIDDEVKDKSQQKPQTPKQLKQESKKEPYRGR